MTNTKTLVKPRIDRKAKPVKGRPEVQGWPPRLEVPKDVRYVRCDVGGLIPRSD